MINTRLGSIRNGYRSAKARKKDWGRYKIKEFYLILMGALPPKPPGIYRFMAKAEDWKNNKEGGANSVPAPPLLRHLSRRSGRVPALPYPPLRQIEYNRTWLLEKETINHGEPR